LEKGIGVSGGKPAEFDSTVREVRKRETLVFLFLAVVLMPILAVAVVGGYGFAVWMYQLVVGPPGS
jgi:periplasmic nitrate reductase NapE